MQETATAQSSPRLAPRNSQWVRFVLRRGRRLLLSIWLLLTGAFFMIHLVPGDPVRAALGTTAAEAVVEARRRELGLDKPIHQQYFDYMLGVLQGNLGQSIATRASVAEIIWARLPATLTLVAAAFVLTLLLALPLGLLMAALTRNSRRPRLEAGYTVSSVIVAAIPDFVLAVGLVAVFGVGLGVVPVAGNRGAISLIVPAVALAAGPAAILSRVMRIETMAVLGTDFIRTARAKRMSPVRLMVKHALPSSVTSTLTVGGLVLAALLVGTVLVENVVAWPGLGSTVVNSILIKDYPLVQGILLVYGTSALLIHFSVDLALAIVDPRSSVVEA